MKAANELIEAASMETESGLEDILLVRKLLEGYAAEACAERIEPKELPEIKDLQADYLYAIRHGRAGSEEDLAFHLKIAHLSGQPVYPADVKAHPDRPGRLCALQPGNSPL